MNPSLQFVSQINLNALALIADESTVNYTQGRHFQAFLAEY